MKEPTTWGRWTFDRDVLVLDFNHGEYEIDLEDCTSSAAVLDWICQLNGKSWTTTEDIGDLVQAFDDLLRPQANLCSFGRDRRMPVSRDMLLERERELIAHRIIKAARPAGVDGLPPVRASYALGSYFADHARAEKIVRQYPCMSFDGLVRAYIAERQAYDDLAAAA